MRIPAILSASSICLATFLGMSNAYSQTLTGGWIGELQISSKPDLWKKSETDPISFSIQTCGGETEIRFSQDGKIYKKMSGPFDVKSVNGSTLITTINSQHKWVQTNVWSIVKLSDDEASFQWLRHVNNFTALKEEKGRYFGLLGNGTLKKVSPNCDLFKKQNQ